VTETTRAIEDHEAAPTRPGRQLPPVLERLVRGTFWIALRTPLQAVFALWTVPLILSTVGEEPYGAYGFAWGFGFIQFLLEFGLSSALSRELSDAWTRGDRAQVDRSFRAGVAFYALMALIQAAALVAIARFGVPGTFAPASRTLVIQLLLLQAVTAPCYGISVLLSSMLQAARRYDVIPRYELVIVVLRFLILAGGLKAGWGLFTVVVLQTIVQIGLGLGPAAWIMVRELGYRPRVAPVRLADYRALLNLSLGMFAIQLSVVLADKLDTTILGYALPDPAPAISVYQTVSKPFLQIRQMGWMLGYLVMPAVASLVASRDHATLDRIKYDGTRTLVALLLPVTLLAAVYARPFLAVWVPIYRDQAWLMQLFLVAALPLILSVLVQVSIGMGKIWPIAIAALAGAIVNLPLSFLLTRWIGVSGVIWGTVLTTLVSNGLVPGLYVFRTIPVDARRFVIETLRPPVLAGLAALAVSLTLSRIWSADPRGPNLAARAGPLVIHLLIGTASYAAAYGLTSIGRHDLRRLKGRLFRPRSAG
jgi:O-antigen/teichoic acid export membrane protein